MIKKNNAGKDLKKGDDAAVRKTFIDYSEKSPSMTVFHPFFGRRKLDE